MRKFRAVLSARNKEFTRDRAALSWNLMFPVLVIFGFAYTFSGKSQDFFKVSVVTSAPSTTQQPVVAKNKFTQLDYIQFVASDNLTQSLEKLKRHQVDLVYNEESNAIRKYWINSTSPKGYLVEKILLGTETSEIKYQKQVVEGREIRYVDWLISGLLAMNMMFSALFGVGYNMVRYRKNGVLKRLRATPLSAFEFLLAQVVSRLILILSVTTVVYIGCHAFIHFQMLGSYFNLLLVTALGAMCLISLSLLVASRVSSEEFAGGLLNLISWPMMFLSGVWFSLEGAHPWVQKAAQIFPLTHVIDAARAIMTEGAGLQAISYNLIALTLMTVVFLFSGSMAFKWK